MTMDMLSKEDFKTVARVPLFSGLTPTSVAELLNGSFVRSFSTESLLFLAGDPADRLFVVLSGAVRLGILDCQGNETIIEVIGPGTSFGEGALFASRRYPVQAEALAGTRLVSINGPRFIGTMAATANGRVASAQTPVARSAAGPVLAVVGRGDGPGRLYPASLPQEPDCKMDRDYARKPFPRVVPTRPLRR